MISEKFSYKKFFITYGIFIGIVALTILILIYSVTISRKSWQKNLQVCVEKVLEEKLPEQHFQVTGYQVINNPFSLNAACYDLIDSDTEDLFKAVILRVTTLYGPLPAVFLVDSDNDVNFVGYSSLHGRVAVQLETKLSSKRIDYWTKKIPEIIDLPARIVVAEDTVSEEETESKE